MRFGRRSKHALVLGCGPAGLFAAHGLLQNDWDVTIFSNRRKSHMFGAQYLHAPIDGLSPADEEPETIRYKLVGEAEGYREKVYGINAVATSVELLGKEHQAWDIRKAYDSAWEMYGPHVNDAQIGPQVLGVMKWSPDLQPKVVGAIDVDQFDVVVSSIPLTRLCYRPDVHQFHSVSIWAYGDAPERGQYVPYRPVPNTVECNGEPFTGWYRAANVYDHATMEWPGNRKPPLPGIAQVTKPIYSTCDCYRDGLFKPKFVPVGRYGTWTKGVLSHHAYTTAVNL